VEELPRALRVNAVGEIPVPVALPQSEEPKLEQSTEDEQGEDREGKPVPEGCPPSTRPGATFGDS
jgi:hypothetical protein